MSKSSIISEIFSEFGVTEKLGITGSTVVYIFPDGNAYSNQKMAAPPNLKADSLPSSVAVQEQSIPEQPLPTGLKRLGEKLVDANLITAIQRDVALYDQKLTGMRIGEILVARGWVSEEIVEQLADSQQ